MDLERPSYLSHTYLTHNPLTPTVSSAIRQKAEKQGLTESEALERLIRYINALPLPNFDKKSD